MSLFKRISRGTTTDEDSIYVWYLLSFWLLLGTFVGIFIGLSLKIGT